MQQEGIAPDVITYNSLLKAAAAGGLLGEARRLYSELLQAGLAPSTFTYAALFSAAARARSSDAVWLLQVGLLHTARVEAHTKPGLCPVHLLRRTGAGSAPADASPCCLPRHVAAPISRRPQMFDEMQRLGVQPNNHVVSALFAAASFAPCTPAQLERLFAALALLRRWGHALRLQSDALPGRALSCGWCQFSHAPGYKPAESLLSGHAMSWRRT